MLTVHRRYYFVVGIIIIIVIAVLFLYFLMQKRSREGVVTKQEIQNEIQNKINQIEQDVIKNAPTSFKDASGNSIALFNEMADQAFAITYLQESHTFKIDLKGINLEQEKKAAEEFLLNEVFKTRDTAIVCNIKVSFVDISPAFRIDEELAKIETKNNGLTLEQRDALIRELEQKFGHPKVISEKLSICE